MLATSSLEEENKKLKDELAEKDATLARLKDKVVV